MPLHLLYWHGLCFIIKAMGTKTLINVAVKRDLCPFLKEPRQECYCVRMSSQDIERAVTYCVSRYHLCEIYNRNNGGNGGKREILSSK